MKINLDIKTSTDLCRYLEPNKARVFFEVPNKCDVEVGYGSIGLGKLLYGVDFYKKLLWTDVFPWLRDNKILSYEEACISSLILYNKWRRKAGCSCGCSSGIILPRELFQNDQPIDVHVTVKEEGKQND